MFSSYKRLFCRFPRCCLQPTSRTYFQWVNQWMEEKENFLTLSETLRHNFWKIKKLSTFCSSCFNNAVYTAFIHNERNHIASLITPIKYVFFLEEKKNEILGAFYSTKKSGLNFWQLPVARRRTFSKISKKIDYGKSPICPHG